MTKVVAASGTSSSSSNISKRKWDWFLIVFFFFSSPLCISAWLWFVYVTLLTSNDVNERISLRLLLLPLRLQLQQLAMMPKRTRLHKNSKNENWFLLNFIRTQHWRAPSALDAYKLNGCVCAKPQKNNQQINTTCYVWVDCGVWSLFWRIFRNGDKCSAWEGRRRGKKWMTPMKGTSDNTDWATNCRRLAFERTKFCHFRFRNLHLIAPPQATRQRKHVWSSFWLINYRRIYWPIRRRLHRLWDPSYRIASAGHKTEQSCIVSPWRVIDTKFELQQAIFAGDFHESISGIRFVRTRLHSSTHKQHTTSGTHFEHSASLNRNLFLESLIFLFIISFCYYRPLQWRKLNSEIDSSTTIFQQRPRRRRHAVCVYFEKLESNWIWTHFMFEKCRLETEILYFWH